MEGLFNFELDLMDKLGRVLPEFIKQLALLLTEFGGQTILIGIIGIIYWIIDKKLGEKIGFIAIANVGLNNILKGCFMEKRPFQHDGYAHLEAFPGEGSPSGSSFPSGHSQNSATIYSLVAMNFKQKWLKIVSIVLLIIVPLTRVIIGVHFPHDVLVGSLLGIGVAVLLSHLYNKYYEKRQYLYIAVIILYLPFMFIVPTKDFFVGYGLLLGFVLGTTIERRYINFSNDVSWKKMILRILAGLVTILIFKAGFKALLSLIFEDIPYIFDLIRYFLIAFAATGLVPFLFKSEKNTKGI